MQYIPQANAANNFFATSAASAHLTDNKGGIRGDLNTRYGNFFAYYLHRQFLAQRPLWQWSNHSRLYISEPGGRAHR